MKNKKDLVRRTFIKSGLLLIGIPFVPTILTACGGGSDNTPSSPPATPAPPTASLSGISPSSPTALTAFALTTSGIDTTQPFQVTMIYPDGQSTQVTPIRSDVNTIVLPTPLALDATTGNTAPFTFNINVTQNGVTTNTLSVTTTDLPSVASYGVSPGAISKNFLNYLTISFGKARNHWQAVQAFPANTVSTANERSLIGLHLNNSIMMRSSVDLIMTGSQPSLGVGKATDGSPIQFNAQSVDLMDRIIALHLQNIGYLPNTAISNLEVIEREASAVEKAAGSAITTLISGLSSAAGSDSMMNAVLGSVQHTDGTSRTVTDNVVSGVNGVAGFVAAIAGLAAAPEVATAAALVGVAAGSYAVVRDIQNWDSSAPFIPQASSMAADAVGTAASLLGVSAIGKAGTLLNEVTTALQNIGSDGVSGVVTQGAGFFSNVASNYFNVANLASANAQNQSAGATQPIGTVSGAASVTNSAPANLAGLSEISLTDPNTGTQFTGICDASGAYNLAVPLAIPGFNYTNMILSVLDPLTQTQLGSTLGINITGLQSGGTLTAPTITGSCMDDDAGSPDADDPDCD